MATAAQSQSKFSVTVSLQDGAFKKEATGEISVIDAEAFADQMVSAALAIRGLARESIEKQQTVS